MQVTIDSTPPERLRADCLVVGVRRGRRLESAAAAVDAASDKHLSRVLRRVAFEAAPGDTVLLHEVPGIAAHAVLALGLGDRGPLEAQRFAKAIGAAAEALVGAGMRSAAFALAALEVEQREAAWCVRRIVETCRAACYRFDHFHRDRQRRRRPRLAALLIEATDRAAVGAARAALREAQAVADGVALARELADLPANVCTPSHLAARARRLARAHPSLTVQVRGEREIRRLGMGALLAVARGSREPPRLITLEYRGAPRGAAPVALVGKGVTFDSGGISIKPSAAMDEMKYDMSGAAAVLAAVSVAASLELPLNVVAVVPATENLPGGNATRPGDIVRTLSGLSVEILNTDAEGRLILCDALAFAARYKPAVVIDVATLTGACVVALGSHASGLFSNDETLAEALLGAGERSGDRAWRMPVWDEYREQLKSRFADLANIGGREAGAVTAACFLRRFVDDQRWAHLDIAGTAWRSGRRKGATGRPVPLLAQFLIERARGR